MKTYHFLHFLSNDKLFIVVIYSGRTVSKGNLYVVLTSCNNN